MRSVLLLVAGMAVKAVAFVTPISSFNGVNVGRLAPSFRSASNLMMAEEPLGVGVIGCGRIGDVSHHAIAVMCLPDGAGFSLLSVLGSFSISIGV